MSRGASDTSGLTAAVIARAIVAAAQVYGDNPERATRAKRGPARRCLTPACAGLAEATGLRFYQVAAILGIGSRNLSRSQLAGAAFEEACAAAADAARQVLGARPAPSLQLTCAPEPEREPAPVIVAPRPPEEIFGEMRAIVARPVRVLSAGAAKRVVRAALAESPASSPTLAEQLGLSLAQVREALRELREDSRVALDVIGATWRDHIWCAI